MLDIRLSASSQVTSLPVFVCRRFLLLMLDGFIVRKYRDPYLPVITRFELDE
jgi:hypothetical protein